MSTSDTTRPTLRERPTAVRAAAGHAGRVRVALADADARVRSALRFVLEQAFGAVVCPEAGSVAALLAAAKTDRLDMVVLDWDLACRAARGPAAVIALLSHANHSPAVIVLGRDATAAPAARAAGAWCFVAKASSPECVLQVLGRATDRAQRSAARQADRSGW